MLTRGASSDGGVRFCARLRQSVSRAVVAGGVVPGSLPSSGGVMSKLYRSMLWSGLVVAGVAACGDDVSIVQPPAPVLTVHSISVAPNGVTVGIGANVITMSAAVNADAGV